MNISRTAINMVVIGAVIGAILGGILGYAILEPPIVSSDIMPKAIIAFTALGAVLGGVIYRIKVHAAQPVTRTQQSRFIGFLVIGFIVSLFMGHFLISLIIGLGIIGAWYSLQKMSD